MTTDELVAEALKLDRKARGKLASRLLRSLDDEQEKLSPEQCEKLWLAEAERRLEEWEQGKVTGIPSEEVFARARAVLSS
jgi:putative addiction module component (TIGR02574 family)